MKKKNIIIIVAILVFILMLMIFSVNYILKIFFISFLIQLPFHLRTTVLHDFCSIKQQFTDMRRDAISNGTVNLDRSTHLIRSRYRHEPDTTVIMLLHDIRSFDDLRPICSLPSEWLFYLFDVYTRSGYIAAGYRTSPARKRRRYVTSSFRVAPSEYSAGGITKTDHD